ncbi:hypothetical protein COLO4_16651 [Corchorus olitorius]|uniref:Uncharacterized protein n=1 Tax=Corchorus olitorius TaxID=93759 RepID=A0A1R3JG69_9ROSI|nr:hypothetical protein COLO4_16651 [Corchorus olitorius]
MLANDVDGTSDSKSKGYASKKQKVEKESSKEGGLSNKDKVAGKKQANKSPTKVSANTQGKGRSGKKPKVEPSREEIIK